MRPPISNARNFSLRDLNFSAAGAVVVFALWRYRDAAVTVFFTVPFDALFDARIDNVSLCFAITAARGTIGCGVFKMRFAGVRDAKRLVLAVLGVVPLFADESSRVFSLDSASSATNLGDRRTGVLSLSFALAGVFEHPFAASRLGAPNRRPGVLPGVFPPSALFPRAPSLGDVLSTSPFTPLFSGSDMNVDAASMGIVCVALNPLDVAPARTRVPRGVVNARGAALSKYDSTPASASATSGSASKS